MLLLPIVLKHKINNSSNSNSLVKKYPSPYYTPIHTIKKELYLYVTPTVMLIDPEGTTLIRGGHKEEAIRKVLGKNL